MGRPRVKYYSVKDDCLVNDRFLFAENTCVYKLIMYKQHNYYFAYGFEKNMWYKQNVMDGGSDIRRSFSENAKIVELSKKEVEKLIISTTVLKELID